MEATRAPIETVMPAHLDSMSSHSPGVHARADLDTQLVDPLSDLQGAADGPGGSVERGVGAVAGRVVLDAMPRPKALAHDRMMTLDEVLPPVVAELGLLLG